MLSRRPVTFVIYISHNQSVLLLSQSLCPAPTEATDAPLDSKSGSAEGCQEEQRVRSTALRGEVLESQDTIILENVPIITPNRDEVASDLTFTVSASTPSTLVWQGAKVLLYAY